MFIWSISKGPRNVTMQQLSKGKWLLNYPQEFSRNASVMICLPLFMIHETQTIENKSQTKEKNCCGISGHKKTQLWNNYLNKSPFFSTHSRGSHHFHSSVCYSIRLESKMQLLFLFHHVWTIQSKGINASKYPTWSVQLLTPLPSSAWGSLSNSFRL